MYYEKFYSIYNHMYFLYVFYNHNMYFKTRFAIQIIKINVFKNIKYNNVIEYLTHTL